MRNLGIFLLCGLAPVLAGCGNTVAFGRGGGTANAEGPRPWPYVQGTREPLDPTWINPAEIYRRAYLSWKAEHDTFAESIEKDTLGREAAFKRLTGALKTMGDQLDNPELADRLHEILKRYDRLNSSISRGNRNRATTRSVEDLRQTVIRHFEPEVIEVRVPRVAETPVDATPAPTAPPTVTEPAAPPAEVVDVGAMKDAAAKWEPAHDTLAATVGDAAAAQAAGADLETALAAVKTALPPSRLPPFQICLDEYRRLQTRLAQGESTYELRRQLDLMKKEMNRLLSVP